MKHIILSAFTVIFISPHINAIMVPVDPTDEKKDLKTSASNAGNLKISSVLTKGSSEEWEPIQGLGKVAINGKGETILDGKKEVKNDGHETTTISHNEPNPGQKKEITWIKIESNPKGFKTFVIPGNEEESLGSHRGQATTNHNKFRLVIHKFRNAGHEEPSFEKYKELRIGQERLRQGSHKVLGHHDHLTIRDGKVFLVQTGDVVRNIGGHDHIRLGRYRSLSREHHKQPVLGGQEMDSMGSHSLLSLRALDQLSAGSHKISQEDIKLLSQMTHIETSLTDHEGLSLGHEEFGLGKGHGDERHVKGVTITKELRVPVPQPFPVPVEKQVFYPIKVPYEVKVEKPFAVHVDKPFPVFIEKRVPIAVEKTVPYPVKVHVKVPVPVHHAVAIPKPVPVEVPISHPYPVEVPVIFEKKVPVYVKDHHHLQSQGVKEVHFGGE